MSEVVRAAPSLVSDQIPPLYRYVYATAAHAVPAYKNLPNAHYNAQYGDSLWRGELQFRPSGWNDVSVRVRLNTPGEADGGLRVAVNGVVREFEGMQWRCGDAADVTVAGVFFSTFYGGSQPKHACPVDTCIRFREFTLHKWA